MCVAASLTPGFECVCILFLSVPNGVFSSPLCIFTWHRVLLLRAMQDGYTALLFCAEEGYTECVRLLLESGADTGAQTRNVRHTHFYSRFIK